MNEKIQDSLRRIQEQAKRRAAETMKSAGVTPLASTVSADSLKLFREEIGSAVAKAISTKVAREYAGDLAEKMRDVAADRLRAMQREIPEGPHLGKTLDGQILLYPQNCRLFIQNGDYGNVILEESPQLRTIFTGGRIGNKNETARIPLPYMIFTLGFREVQGEYHAASCGIGFRTKPITSIDDVIYAPTLPHCGATGTCMPHPVGAKKSISDLTNAYLESFWQSKFVYPFRKFNIVDGDNKKKTINSFKEWEKINPLDILKAKFTDSGYTVRQLLARNADQNAMIHTGPLQKAMRGIVHNLTNAIDSDDLSGKIHAATQQIVNTALQNSFGDSALQPN